MGYVWTQGGLHTEMSQGVLSRFPVKYRYKNWGFHPFKSNCPELCSTWKQRKVYTETKLLLRNWFSPSLQTFCANKEVCALLSGPSQSHLINGSIEDEIPSQEQSLTLHSLHPLAQACFPAGWPEKARHIPVLTLLPGVSWPVRNDAVGLRESHFPTLCPCGFSFFTLMILLSLALMRRNNFFYLIIQQTTLY